MALFFTGDVQGKLMFQQQPMKMASAESLCHTETDPDFSVLTVGTHNNCDSVTHLIEVPYVLPFLAEGKFSGVTLEGVKDLQEQYEQQVRPRRLPAQPVRHLLGVPRHDRIAGGPSGFRGGRAVADPRAAGSPISAGSAGSRCSRIPTPFLANSAGWVFTEMGRQPWVVVPNPTGDQMVRLTVQEGVSDHSAGMVVISLAVFTLLYAVLAVIWFWLMRRYVVEGPLEHDSEPAPPTPPGRRRRRAAVLRVLRRTRSMGLQELGSSLIAALFLGFLVLEGFDFGVGMLMAPFGAACAKGDPEKRRRAALNTIGPVWDGNEVWLITAGAAMFAAFPNWYATVFSALYLPLLAILFGDDPARRRHRMARQGRRPDGGAAGPTSASRSGPGCPRSCGASRSRSWCAGLPIDADDQRRTCRSAMCSTPTRCWAGWRPRRCSRSTARCSWR